MKPFIFIFIFIALTAQSIFAQSPEKQRLKGHQPEHEQWRAVQRQQMIDALELDEQQQRQWQRIVEKYDLQRKGYRDQHEAQRNAHRQRMMESRQAQRNELDAILTPEQRERFEAHIAEKKAHEGERKRQRKQQHARD